MTDVHVLGPFRCYLRCYDRPWQCFSVQRSANAKDLGTQCVKTQMAWRKRGGALPNIRLHACVLCGTEERTRATLCEVVSDAQVLAVVSQDRRQWSGMLSYVRFDDQLNMINDAYTSGGPILNVNLVSDISLRRPTLSPELTRKSEV